MLEPFGSSVLCSDRTAKSAAIAHSRGGGGAGHPVYFAETFIDPGR
jgi:hypothetical protein